MQCRSAGNKRVPARKRLSRRRALARVLWDWLLIDSQERFASDAIEDINPSRLARFGDGFAGTPVYLYVEKNDGVRRIVIPDVMVDLLKVPAILSRTCF